MIPWEHPLIVITGCLIALTLAIGLVVKVDSGPTPKVVTRTVHHGSPCGTSGIKTIIQANGENGLNSYAVICNNGNTIDR